MPDVRLERDFAVSPEILFEFISSTEGLLQWWGPEGMFVPEHNLNFTQTGPWFSVMANDEGQSFKVSGQVTHVDPPKSVGLTWAWHDEHDVRGEESHVTLMVSATDTGARLVVDHRELATVESAESHKMGWVSTLNKLAAATAG